MSIDKEKPKWSKSLDKNIVINGVNAHANDIEFLQSKYELSSIPLYEILNKKITPPTIPNSFVKNFLQTEEELHKNLGTIAKSGTKEFMEKLKQAKENAENNLIGQFGVGFYSAFMVADKVEVETKSNESEKAFKWTSDGKSAYDVSESKKTTRGTVITLYIDEANKELLQEWKVKDLIKKYSNQ